MNALPTTEEEQSAKHLSRIAAAAVAAAVVYPIAFDGGTSAVNLMTWIGFTALAIAVGITLERLFPR